MRTPLVAGNWKMHGSRAGTIQLISEVISGLQGDAGGVEVVVCPPAVYLDAAAQALQSQTLVALGAQDVATAEEGAFTGDVSAPMLADVGCRYVIVGHSERRAGHGESDALVAQKFCAARRQGLTPILCVGEQAAQREAGQTAAVIEAQLAAVVEAAGATAVGEAVVAYEPVWAIGTGATATPEQAQEVHAHVRALLAAEDAVAGRSVRILYGGSVKPQNAGSLFAMDDVDGGLIGGASLQAGDFLAICSAAR